MSSTRVSQNDWVNFYHELAEKLLAFLSNRLELVKSLRAIYERAGMTMPVLDRDEQLEDIDPFTVFALFNKRPLLMEKRRSIAAGLAGLLNLKSPVPQDFSSVPVLDSRGVTFYRFRGERHERAMDELWDFFRAALSYAEQRSETTLHELSACFDRVIHFKGNSNSKITMGLHWIAPYTFLNLDRRSSWYIYDSGKLPQEWTRSLPSPKAPISASRYFAITEKLRTFLEQGGSDIRNFVELSSEAWRYSEEVNEQKKRQAGDFAETLVQSVPENRDLAMDSTGKTRATHYWTYSPGEDAVYWEEFCREGIMAIGLETLGDLRAYAGKADIQMKLRDGLASPSSPKVTALRAWQFAHEMQPGDVIYAKRGTQVILGRGVVASDYYYDASRDTYRNVRRVRWTHCGEWKHPFRAARKILTDITSYQRDVRALAELFENLSPGGTHSPNTPGTSPDRISEAGAFAGERDAETQFSGQQVHPTYGVDRFLEEVFMSRESYDTLVSLLRHRKNVILQGAPGVGKTFVAKRLAYSMIGEEDPERVMAVQFHQSYSYEDFVMGYRPSEQGLVLKYGVFYRFCKTAQNNPDRDYFFLIDEINRGNMSRILGELFTLIEPDKRGESLHLLYQDERFCVPPNVYLIGMMNTADRSLALLDFALRRRFAFFEMAPGYESEGFRRYWEGLQCPAFSSLMSCVQRLNEAIEHDETLGEGFLIGHSFFCGLDEIPSMERVEALSRIVEFELIPLLKEYWFESPEKEKLWSTQLRSAIK